MYYEFEWDEFNILHATEHGISIKEIEECFDNEHLVVAKPRSLKKHGEQRHYLLGRTSGNKSIFLVFKKLIENRVRVISARLMKKTEERKYEV